MFLKGINKINDTSYKLFYEYALGILAGLLVFRGQATILIILFIVLNLVFINRVRFDKTKILPIIIIAIPFFLNVIFIWNNDIFYEALKHGEKYLSCIFFPGLIVLQRFKISIKRVLNIYSILFTFLLLVCFIKHFIIDYNQFLKYFDGELVWQMGYNFAFSMNLHAPALNMHVAFLVIINLILLLNDYFAQTVKKKIVLRIVIFVSSIIILFLINTRLAILNVFIGIPLVSMVILFKNAPKRKAIKITSLIIGIILILASIFVLVFPYVLDKYSKVTFKHMDKIGQLDSFENPEAEVYSALVTRISIWKTTVDVISKNVIYGVGSADGKKELIRAYKQTNQKFLEKHEFPVHNQYLDFFLKFGILGLIGSIIYVFFPFWLYFKYKKPFVLFFFILFFTSNLTDDFLIRYDGIVFSAFWLSVFSNIAFFKTNKSELKIQNSY